MKTQGKCSEPVRQHYVPEMLLKRFANDEGTLNLYRKEDNKFLKGLLPRNVLLKRHINTHKPLTETTGIPELDRLIECASKEFPYAIEQCFASAEKETSPIIDKIEKQEQLTSHEENVLRNFVYIQIYRTPWGRRQVKQEFLEAIPYDKQKHFLDAWEQYSGIFFQLVLAGECRKQFFQTVEKPFYIVTNPFRTEPFVTSDVPVLISDDSDDVIFPISRCQFIYFNQKETDNSFAYYNNQNIPMIEIILKDHLLCGNNIINEFVWKSKSTQIVGDFKEEDSEKYLK